jgi:uncharacterized cupredoxin-like copper-binding protein
MSKMTFTDVAAPVLWAWAAAVLITGSPLPAHAHDERDSFSAGAPGDPKKPSRTVKVAMREEGTKMMFAPARIMVRKGEQIRFVLDNDGLKNHEFVLATPAENREHAEFMKRFPDMEHDDPNGKRLAPYNRGEILWRFTKAGHFEFACLIPGHYKVGMHGTVIVK